MNIFLQFEKQQETEKKKKKQEEEDEEEEEEEQQQQQQQQQRQQDWIRWKTTLRVKPNLLFIGRLDVKVGWKKPS